MKSEIKWDDVWGGVVGGVTNGDYQFCISTRLNKLSRIDMFDMVPVITDRLLLALIPQPPEIDSGLFVRPFRKDVWVVIGIITFVYLLIYFLPLKFVYRYGNSASRRIVGSMGWLFFLLLFHLNSYTTSTLTTLQLLLHRNSYYNYHLILSFLFLFFILCSYSDSYS